METVILKIILSSGLLIGFYYLFLERERIFQFNRFFLLTALAFAYLIPFIPFNSPFTTTGNSVLIVGEPLQELQQSNISNEANFNWIKIILILYGVISLYFLLKFIYSIVKIKLLKGEKRNYGNQRILIINQNYAPFSFLDTIYFSRKYLINDQIEERIFLHEQCHIEQKHSVDILFIEFLKIFSWFNPALYVFKKAMITNHEFLADEYVLQNNHDISNYQHLILNEIKLAQSFNLTHQFDFNNTKKRFIMMTSKNSQFTWLKKFALLPVLAALFLFFTKKVNAQTESSVIDAETTIQNKKQDVAVLMNEKNATAEETAFIQTSKKLFEEFESGKDTIQKKEAQDVAIPVPPPPPPSEFRQVMAEFPGGANALRKLVSNAFDTSVFKGDEGLLKTTIYLSLDETGKISNITAEGDHNGFNAEAIRAVAMANEGKSWKPATEDNNPVKTVYKLPLTMKFEGPVIRK